MGRRLAEKVCELDGSRFVTNAVNAFVAVLPDVMAERKQRERTDDAGSGGVNDFMNSVSAMLARISASQASYRQDRRIVLGSGHRGSQLRRVALRERALLVPQSHPRRFRDFPGRIAANWRLVTDHPHVLGDFTWTGWDYLGEAVIGRPRYHDEPAGFSAPYPWRTAWTGDLDITGFRRPSSYYREIVLGIRSEPYLAVVRPESQGRDAVTGGWSWSDVVSSWTWSAERQVRP